MFVCTYIRSELVILKMNRGAEKLVEERGCGAEERARDEGENNDVCLLCLGVGCWVLGGG